MKKYLDLRSLAVIVLTLVLFVLAIFLKGFTKDLLLEAGVFLVSVKLILMSYKNAVATEQTRVLLDRIVSMLEEKRAQSKAPDDDGQGRGVSKW